MDSALNHHRRAYFWLYPDCMIKVEKQCNTIQHILRAMYRKRIAGTSFPYDFNVTDGTSHHIKFLVKPWLLHYSIGPVNWSRKFISVLTPRKRTVWLHRFLWESKFLSCSLEEHNKTSVSYTFTFVFSLISLDSQTVCMSATPVARLTRLFTSASLRASR